MSKSNIEWTQESWNAIVGCSILTPGCTNCYAMKMGARVEAMNAEARAAGKKVGAPQYDGTTKVVNGKAVWTGKLSLAEKILLNPLKRKKPTTYFVNSMGDLFHEDCPDEWIDKVFAVMALSPLHTFQVLTKRAKRMRDYMLERWQPQPARRFDLGGGDIVEIPAEAEGADRHDQVAETVDSLIDDLGLVKRFRDPENDAHWTPEGNPICKQFAWPLDNVWLGVSTERQQEADERIPLLLQTPAAIRFISAEPLLGPIDLRRMKLGGGWYDVLAGWRDVKERFPGFDETLDWVIVGGESGTDARPMHPDWARSLRVQCEAAGVPFFFKQWGSHAPSQMAGGAAGLTRDSDKVVACSKKTAGRALDGIEYSEMPEISR